MDLGLLARLQQDAGETNQALAERMGISPPTCLRRVRRLETLGLIERRVALLSPRVSSAALAAVVEISLDRQGAEHLEAFEARAVADPAVAQCWRVTPGPDFVLIVQVIDMAGYQALVARLLTQDANVRNVKTFFATRRAKFSVAVPLAPAGGLQG